MSEWDQVVMVTGFNWIQHWTNKCLDILTLFLDSSRIGSIHWHYSNSARLASRGWPTSRIASSLDAPLVAAATNLQHQRWRQGHGNGRLGARPRTPAPNAGSLWLKVVICCYYLQYFVLTCCDGWKHHVLANLFLACLAIQDLAPGLGTPRPGFYDNIW